MKDPAIQSIAWHCPHCQQLQLSEIQHQELSCSSCQKTPSTMTRINNDFDRCPICECRQFYIQKDFNRGLGCLIVLVGILFVPKTYGLSLPAVALIDWLLYRKTSAMIICYRCGAEYRGFVPPKRLKPYMHHIGLKYDKYR